MPIRSEMDLRNSMLKYGPGETLKVEVVRDGSHKSFDVKVSEAPKMPTERTLSPNRRGGQIPPEFNMPDFEEWRKRFEQPDDVPPLRSGPARLGVIVEAISDSNRKQFHIPKSIVGAVVAEVEPNSAAQRLGLKPGDVIQKLGDRTIKTASDVMEAMKGVTWGDSSRITFVRFQGEGKSTVVSRDVQF
jgi:S1-C subfamily serine protease